MCEAGDDEEDLHRAIARGAPAVAKAPRWLAVALEEDANALDVPRLYDTRDDGDLQALRNAVIANDEAAADAAFERFAGARSLPRRLLETRQALAGVDTPAAQSAARLNVRMAARNAAAARLSEVKATEPVRPIHALQAMGFVSGGALDERLALALDDNGAMEVDVSRLAAALARLGELGDAAAMVTERLRETSALEAFAWLSILRDPRRRSTGQDGVGPLGELLAPFESSWPVLALALFEGESYPWSGPQIVALLSRVRHPAMRTLLMAMLEHSPRAFINGADGIAADWCLAQAPASAADASRWISEVRGMRALHKRYIDRDPQATTRLTLLARSVGLPEVARFFVTDVTRDPHVALVAAKAAAPSDRREILHAIYTGLVPVGVRRSACELAIAQGDARASAALPAIEKARAAESRRLSQM